VDFVRYAERAAGLVNAGLPDAAALVAFLGDERAWLHGQVTDRDAATLRTFQRDLRPVFQASSDGDEHGVVDRLNELLATHPVTPYIAGHGGREGQPPNWHMHVADRESSVAELLVAEPRGHPARRVRREPVLRRLRRHLAQPVPALLLRPLLVARQRRRLPRPPPRRRRRGLRRNPA
jgi:hypothetical protein